MTTVQSGSPEVLSADEALNWIAELFEEPKESMHLERVRGDIDAWDSLGQLVLMSGLDQRFGIRLTQEELASLKSAGDILRVLRSHDRLVEA
jgi:acyl carrier protein